MAIGSYGQQPAQSLVGKPINVAVDHDLKRPTGGISVDWSKVTALAADAYHAIHGLTFPAGAKFLEYGTILCKITKTEVQTATISGSPTGGAFDLEVTIDGVKETALDIPYNATAAQVQAALEALSIVGAGNVNVSRGGSAPNYVYTLTWQRGLSDAAVTLGKVATDLTGGTSPDVTIATTTATQPSGGMYGPYDAAANDGRQTLSRDSCWILDHSMVLAWPNALVNQETNMHPSVFNGGRAYKQRIKAGGAGQPAWADLLAAMPMLELVEF